MPGVLGEAMQELMDITLNVVYMYVFKLAPRTPDAGQSTAAML